MKANFLFIFFCALVCDEVSAQGSGPYRIPFGQPSSLTFTPDARSAGMGEAGVALSADANATYWNPAKLASADREFGVSATYTPWLRNLVDDMWLGYASAYKKLGSKQAIGFAVNYFNTKNSYITGFAEHAYDIAFNGMYARQLGRNFSMGLSLKYISSMPGKGVINGAILQPGRAVATDISAYYRKQINGDNSGEDFNWSLGAVISNLGNKVDYGAGGQYFLPTTLKIGGGISYSASGMHRLNVIADLNKLLVPTPSATPGTRRRNLMEDVLASFSDAPGGFKEEVQEIALAMGAEYWYKDMIALRGGYYGEDKYKGNRKYLTIGAGARILKNCTADISYIIPVTQGSPLAKTMRVTIGAYFGNSKGKG